MNIERFDGTGRLRQRWDDTTRLYTAWNEAGVQTEQRPYTSQEQSEADGRVAAQALSANRDSMREKARQAVTSNNNYLALNSPNNSQNLAQIRSLTRQINALIKLEFDDVSSSDGT
jgi:hypothetical protein